MADAGMDEDDDYDDEEEELDEPVLQIEKHKGEVF